MQAGRQAGRQAPDTGDWKGKGRAPFVLVLQSANKQQAVSIGQTALGLGVGVMDMNVAAWQEVLIRHASFVRYVFFVSAENMTSIVMQKNHKGKHKPLTHIRLLSSCWEKTVPMSRPRHQSRMRLVG